MSTSQAVLASAKAGTLAAHCDAVRTVSGDALMLSLTRVPSGAPATDANSKALCRYIFGAPEGLGRALGDHRTRGLGAVRALFLPALTSEHAGGTTGLRFAMSNAGAEELTVYGPRGTSSLMEAAGAFVAHRHPTLGCVEAHSRTEAGAGAG